MFDVTKMCRKHSKSKFVKTNNNYLIFGNITAVLFLPMNWKKHCIFYGSKQTTTFCANNWPHTHCASQLQENLLPHIPNTTFLCHTHSLIIYFVCTYIVKAYYQKPTILFWFCPETRASQLTFLVDFLIITMFFNEYHF